MIAEPNAKGKATRKAEGEFKHYSIDKNVPVVYQTFCEFILFPKLYQLNVPIADIINFIDWRIYRDGDSMFHGYLLSYALAFTKLEPGAKDGYRSWSWLKGEIDQELTNFNEAGNFDYWTDTYYAEEQYEYMGQFTGILFANLLMLKRIMIDVKPDQIPFSDTVLFRGEGRNHDDTEKHKKVLLYFATMKSDNPLVSRQDAAAYAEDIETMDRRELYDNLYQHMFYYEYHQQNIPIDDAPADADTPHGPPDFRGPRPLFKQKPVVLNEQEQVMFEKQPKPEQNDDSDVSYYSNYYDDSDDSDFDPKKEEAASQNQ